MGGQYFLIGDLHIKIASLPAIDAFIEFMKKTLSTTSEPYEAIVVLGDTLHTHEKVNTLCLNKAVELFTILSKHSPLVILIGNHDYVNAAQNQTDNHPFNSLKKWPNVTVVDKTIRIGECIYTPYMPPSAFLPSLDAIPDWKSAAIVFTHNTVKQYGGACSYVVGPDAPDWSDAFPLLCSGHIHDTWSKGNVYYVGSVVQDSISETIYKYLHVLDMPTKVFIQIPVQFTYKRLIRTSLQKVDEAYASLPTAIPPVFDVRIELKCTLEQYERFKRTSLYKKIKASRVDVLLDCERAVQTSDKRACNINFKETLKDSIVALNKPRVYNMFIKYFTCDVAVVS